MTRKIDDAVSYTPKELEKILAKYFEGDPLESAPLMIWGPPGIGKSQIVRDAAIRAFGDQSKDDEFKSGKKLIPNDLDKFFRDIRLTLADPTRLMGMPAIRGDKAVWLPPSDVPSARGDFYLKGVLILDELASAAPAVQVTAHRLLHDRAIEETKLLDGWFVVAAANRREDNAMVYDMKSPLANRFMAHLIVGHDLESWKGWALNNNVSGEIISFLSWKPDLLLDMKTASESDAFPSPRSWVSCSKLLSMFKDNDVLLNRLVASCIGQGPGREFIGYLQVYGSLPDPKKILEGKEQIPRYSEEDSQILWALTGAVIDVFARDPKKYTENLIALAMKMPAEFGVYMLRDAIRIEGADLYIKRSKNLATFLKDNQNIFI